MNDGDNSAADAASPTAQFSLIRLLSIVTAAGVLLGLWRADLRGLMSDDSAMLLRLVVAFLALGFISFTTGGVWSQRYPMVNFIPAFLGGLATVTAIGCCVGAVVMALRLLLSFGR